MLDDSAPYRYRLSQPARAALAFLAAKTGWSLPDTFPSSRELDHNEQRRVDEELPRLLAALFGSEDGTTASLLKEIDIPDPEAFLSAAVDATLAGSVTGWLLNMGIGGWERLPSWRLIAQVSPLFESARRLQQAGLGIPRVQIFKANALARVVNDLDPALLANTSASTLRFISVYASDWHAQLRPSLELEEDDPAWLGRLVEVVLRPAALSLPIDPDMERLSRNRSSATNGMVYGLAHAFQLQHVVGKDPADRRLWQSGHDRGVPKAVVTFGGIAERLFTRVKRTAIGAAPAGRFERIPHASVITRLCRKPAYMPRADETPIVRVPTLKEMRHQSEIPEIADDWKYLKQLHAFDLAIASGSEAAPLARLASKVQVATPVAA